MANSTNISWTDYTFNPWWGCTRVAPGCKNCYAAALDKRTGGNYWHPKQKPRLTSKKNWDHVKRWNEKAVKENKRYKVFCGSMMDWCDADAPKNALNDLFELIKKTPMLDWQLLTKRADRIKESLPIDWNNGYENVWIGVTVENKKHGFERIDYLRSVPAKIKFISAEPLLSSVRRINLSGIDWVIIGGESGPKARKMDSDWAYELFFQCSIQGQDVWFKQWGGNARDKGGNKIYGMVVQEFPRKLKVAL